MNALALDPLEHGTRRRVLYRARACISTYTHPQAYMSSLFTSRLLAPSRFDIAAFIPILLTLICNGRVAISDAINEHDAAARSLR